jgi:uncharacterized protein with NRDE domain
MCTIAMLLEVVAGAPLVVAANRDEFYARPTRSPARFDGVEGSRGEPIVGGVDVLSGGTWLAVRRDGRFAAVTNQRVLVPPQTGLRSRGLAVRELAAADDPDAYVAAIDPTMYASMNLVWGDAGGASIAYARREGTLDLERLPRGIHVLCNDRLGAEGFPRGDRLRAAIAAAPRTWPEVVPALQAALADHTRVEPPPTHIPIDRARELTATCIHSAGYGTRSSTIFAARPGETLAYLHADGPPCTTPFAELGALLR